jgi:hypothetical protein
MTQLQKYISHNNGFNDESKVTAPVEAAAGKVKSLHSCPRDHGQRPADNNRMKTIVDE